jgi:hypothetical protein
MGESSLDMELIYPLIYPQNITLYQTDDPYYSQFTKGIFNTFLDAIDGVSGLLKNEIRSLSDHDVVLLYLFRLWRDWK